MEIIQFRGLVSPYIGSVPGKATLKLLHMVPRALGQELSVLIDEARANGAGVQKKDIQVEIHGTWKPVTVRVFPIKSPSSAEFVFLIFFEERSQVSPSWEPHKGPERRAKPMPVEVAVLENAQLKQQLFALEAHLQSTIEKSDALNEELLSANEEILSTNEELQAGNEELETTKEELQSTNEELTTLNSELKSSADEAYQARDRSQRIIDTVRQPLLVLDPSLRILQANQTFLET